MNSKSTLFSKRPLIASPKASPTSITAVLLAAAFGVSLASLQAGTAPEVTIGVKQDELADLTVGNLFSQGWDEPWTKHPHPGGAPDMSLLRVQNNFLERELRLDYFYQDSADGAKTAHSHYASALVAWGLNRRVMLGIVGIEQWNESESGKDESGTSASALLRLQLIDNVNSSYALNIRATMPNRGLGEDLTTIAAGPAGWEDLTRFGLHRVGLYWHVQEEAHAGPTAPGARSNALTYDVSLAKTWTQPDAAVENFSTFVETFARTDLDGDHSGRTALSLTPGIRMTFDHGKHVLMGGVDIPVGGYRVIDSVFRFTYVYNF